MINVDGYKAFNGTMQIIPICEEIKPFELTGDWLYKPDTGCWYGKGTSFPSEMCKIIEEN